MAKGLIIAAPSSGSGKTLVTLGLLRAMKRRGICVAGAKVGPDYIDPRFHEVASGKPCLNLDLWAMGTEQVRTLAGQTDAELTLIEGVMGLFDGADGGGGSSADVAAALDLPIILVIDATSQSQSVAAIIHGFASFRDDIRVKGVLLNKVGSVRHEQLLREAAASINMPVVGAIHRSTEFIIPSRHLGLVQAREQHELDVLMERAADLIDTHCDLDVLVNLAEVLPEKTNGANKLAPLGQRIAVADDNAFAFAYPHLLKDWRAAGAEILPFSPLANEAPDGKADAIFLPGGYPELYAPLLANNDVFLQGVRQLANTALIYGECGGFMVLGDALIDAEGASHKMLGLLPVTTSFAKRTRHLGYRKLIHSSPLPWPKELRGHEFHYSTLMTSGNGETLFDGRDSRGNALGSFGLLNGSVMGSYAHVISGAPQ